MIRNRLFVLLTCFFGSVFLVFLLCFISESKRQQPNSFTRLLPPHVIIPGNILDLHKSGWYFAGEKEDTIYLGNFYVADRLLKINLQLKDTISFKLLFPRNTKLLQGCFYMINNSSIFVLDGNQPAIFKGDLVSNKLNFAGTPPYFTHAIFTRKNSFILRVVENGENKLVSYKIDSIAATKSANLLEKQVDGIFCTDGNLIKVPNANKFFYVYYYRNQFVCADENLKLVYKGRTIDTVSRAKIKVATIKSQNETTLAVPPFYVNKQSAANEKFLFIHSGLKADNEIDGTLDEMSVIDVYQVKDGKYKFSFYLHDFNGKKLTDFKVIGQSLYALYDHYLYEYKLNF